MSAGLGLGVLFSVAVLGCAGVKATAPSSGNGGSGAASTGAGGSGNYTGGGAGSPVIVPSTCSPCTDFPTDPLIDVGLPSNVTSAFGSPSGSAPCVTEPEDGSLFPNNWLRPRVRVPGNTQDMKITVHADREANDLVAYANGETWTMPKSIWMALAQHVVEEDISVTVQIRGGGATTVKFEVAPVSAAGSMVFWSADPKQAGKQGVESLPQSMVVNDSYLVGFTVGDESTTPTLKVDTVQQQVFTNDQHNTRTSRCIGCHNGTPDGNYVSFVDAWPWPVAIASVKPDPNNMNKTGSALTGYEGVVCSTNNNMNMCTGTPTMVQFAWNGPMVFSPSHWSDTDKIGIISTQMKDWTQPWSSQNWQPGRLAWVNLQSTATTTSNGLTVPMQGAAYDYLARTGDPNPAAAFPTWSHDGSSIVYVSVACPNPGQQNGCGTQDGRLYKGPADLYEIPYGMGQGGMARPVDGAASTDGEEYYPAFSPDDSLIAFTRVPKGEEMYANPDAELYVVSHTAGSKATRLVANDPPQCAKHPSPGINNHWPRWAPDASRSGSNIYYWVVFSSNRYGLPTVTTNFNGASKTVEVSQLYIAAVKKDEIGIHTYPAIYLWNQPQDRLNTTPAWENFHIPVVIN